MTRESIEKITITGKFHKNHQHRFVNSFFFYKFKHCDFTFIDPYKKLDYENPTKMSEVMRYYGYEDVREYPQPYEKRAYMTNKIDLATNGYAKWLSERHDLIVGVQPDPDYSFPGGRDSNE